MAKFSPGEVAVYVGPETNMMGEKVFSYGGHVTIKAVGEPTGLASCKHHDTNCGIYTITNEKMGIAFCAGCSLRKLPGDTDVMQTDWMQRILRGQPIEEEA